MTTLEKGTDIHVRIEKIERQLASVVHAARVAGPFHHSQKSLEISLANAKLKLIEMIMQEIING